MSQPMPASLPKPFSFRAMMSELFGREPSPSVDFEPPVIASLAKPLAQAKVGLFVSCGVFHRTDQTPLQPTNDLSYRLISRETPLADLELAHRAAIRAFALRDLNVAYPRDRMLELERDGVFRELAAYAVSMVGAVSRQEEFMREGVPRIHDEFVSQEVDLVLLLPFCPACHLTVPLVARALEKRGLPTVMTSCLWERIHEYKAPRTAFLDFPMGCPAGKPNEPALQHDVLRAALTIGARSQTSWSVDELPFQWSADGSRAWEDEVRQLYIDDAKGFAERVDSLAKNRQSLAGQERDFAIRCDC
jgi:D-proline reductase (dithiol) PrdB